MIVVQNTAKFSLPTFASLINACLNHGPSPKVTIETRRRRRASTRGRRSSHTERVLTGERTTIFQLFFHLWSQKEKKDEI